MAITITDINEAAPSFKQWESDRVLVISGTEAEPICRFASPAVRQALVVVGTADSEDWQVKVPNFLLEFAGPLALSVVTEDSTSGEVMEIAKAAYVVEPRMKPQDYCYEDNIGYVNWVVKSQEVQDLIDEIQERLDDGALKGDKGDPGDPGPAGQDGAPGQDGADGVGVPASGTTGQYLRKKSGTDYDTEWATMPTEDYWCTKDTTTSAQILAAYNANKICLCNFDGDIYALTTIGANASGEDEDVLCFVCIDGGNVNFLRVYPNDPSWVPSSDTLGNYSKPPSGIPKSDLASAVRTSLDKADDAIPAPATANDDDVLTYDDGVWVAKPGGGGGTTEVFWATYGTTSFSDISAAYSAGKICACIYDSQVYFLNTLTANTSGKFVCTTQTYYSLTVYYNNTWSNSSTLLYAKPNAGIPKTDLYSTVQTSLGKADAAIPAPSSPSSGQFLKYNGSAWVAADLPVYNGGVS